VVDRWLEIAPNTLLAWERRCECYLRKKMPPEAMESATRAVEIDPNDIWATCYVAKAHRLAGDLDAARAAVRRALVIDPTNEHAKSLQGELG
jgi:Tfp pilus assembly protein PilF